MPTMFRLHHMKSIAAGRLLGCLILLLPVSAYAAVVTGIYQTTVAVADQSVTVRNAALKQALANVLVKVTGQLNAASSPALQDMLAHPDKVLQQYRYQQPATSTPADTTTSTMTGTQPGQKPGLQLLVNFDPRAVRSKVEAAGLPVWGRERPEVMLWVAMQDGRSRFMVSAGQTSTAQAAQQLQQAADARALPVIMPLLDLQDQQALAFDDVWAGFDGKIRQASARYSPDAILVGAVYPIGQGQWAGRWHLLAGAGGELPLPSDSGGFADVLAGGVNAAADIYASRLALQPGQVTPGNVDVVVSGISDLDAYAKVLAFLHSLTAVKSVHVVLAEGDKVTYRLNVDGDVKQLVQAISLGDVMKPETMTPDDTQAVGTMPNNPTNGSNTPATGSVVTIPVLHFQYQP